MTVYRALILQLPLLPRGGLPKVVKSVIGLAGFAVISLAAGAPPRKAPDRITKIVDLSRTTVLRGNLHPLAQTRFDQGQWSPRQI